MVGRAEPKNRFQNGYSSEPRANLSTRLTSLSLCHLGQGVFHNDRVSPAALGVVETAVGLSHQLRCQVVSPCERDADADRQGIVFAIVRLKDEPFDLNADPFRNLDRIIAAGSRQEDAKFFWIEFIKKTKRVKG